MDSSLTLDSGEHDFKYRLGLTLIQWKNPITFGIPAIEISFSSSKNNAKSFSAGNRPNFHEFGFAVSFCSSIVT